MAKREYPRIDSTRRNEKWVKKPELAPWCTVAGCPERATHRPEIQVSWFRGDDVSSAPVCKGHATDPLLLLIVAEDWSAENKRKNDEAQAKARARKEK